MTRSALIVILFLLLSVCVIDAQPPAASSHATITRTPRFVVHIEGAKTASSVFSSIVTRLSALAYVDLNSTDPQDWDLRIRSNLDGTKILIERSDFWKVAEFPVSPAVVDNVLSTVAKEANWWAVYNLAPPVKDSKLQIQLRIVPVKGEMTPNGFVVRGEQTGRDLRLGISMGDYFRIEVKNTGSVPVYPQLVDLDQSGVIKCYGCSARYEALPPGQTHEFPLLVATPPAGYEVFRVIATQYPTSLTGFEGAPTRGEQVEGSLRRYLENLPGSIIAPPKEPDWTTASVATDEGFPRTLHVLSVGVGKFADTDLPHLEGPANDVRDVAALLQEYGAKAYDRTDIHLLVDGEGTRAAVLAALRDVAAHAKPQDTFIFQFSGDTTAQPVTDKDGKVIRKEQLLVTHDFLPKDPIKTSLPITTLQRMFGQIETKNQFFLIDAGATGGLGKMTQELERQNREFGDLDQRNVWVLDTESGYSLELPLDSNDARLHGSVSTAAIKGLRGAADVNHDGNISVAELCNYAKDLVAKQKMTTILDPNGGEAPLRLSVWNSGSDFIIARTSSTSASALSQVPLGDFLTSESAIFPAVHGPSADDVVVAEPAPTATPTRSDPVDEVSSPAAKSDYTRQGKDYALLIGTDDYENSQSWRHLENPVFDTKSIAEELKNYYGFEIDPAADVLLNPKKADVLNALRRAKARTYQPDDQLFIFIAGHGYYDNDTHEGFLIFSDAAPVDRSDTLCGQCDISYLPHSKLRDVLNSIKCNHILVVLDACFSGTFGERTFRGPSGSGYQDLTNRQMIGRIMQFRTRLSLTSGGNEYVPDGTPGQHSPFASKFLEVLRGYGGPYGLVIFDDILAREAWVTPLPRRGEWGDNESGSNFVFVVKKKD
ncbi:MAG: caspase family protein [Acidobacteria bacterium]|nr:caspase family protein [Acidobacteriota bacterium]